VVFSGGAVVELEGADAALLDFVVLENHWAAGMDIVLEADNVTFQYVSIPAAVISAVP
jgi:hypothetical protein